MKPISSFLRGMSLICFWKIFHKTIANIDFAKYMVSKFRAQNTYWNECESNTFNIFFLDFLLYTYGIAKYNVLNATCLTWQEYLVLPPKAMKLVLERKHSIIHLFAGFFLLFAVSKFNKHKRKENRKMVFCSSLLPKRPF